MNKYLFESDYSADSLRWIQIREGNTNKALSSEEIEKLQNEIIANNDSAMAYFFTMEFTGHKPHLMQQLILNNKDAKYAFLFAQNIRNCSIKALQKVVVDSKKVKYICKFACFVKGCDRKPLESIILKSKNVKYAHMFLKHVKGSDVNKFKDVIMSSRKPRYLFELAKHTKDPKVLSQIEDIVIETQSFTYMRLLAEKIKAVNIEKLEQAVLDSDNVNEIKKFAKYVKRSKMKRFFLVL